MRPPRFANDLSRFQPSPDPVTSNPPIPRTFRSQRYSGNLPFIMERFEGIIRWSPNPARDEFAVINFNSRRIQIYEATGRAQPGSFEYKELSKHADVPQLNTYDWSPANPGLVAVGSTQGEVRLLRVDDDSNGSITLPLKLQRSIQSVAFNTNGLLAVGLDRIRNDSCLHIWDVNQRLADWDSTKLGWSSLSNNVTDPKKKLEGSVSVTSVRFFEDQPQTLVVGIKNQSVRIHDLRDPNSAVITFQTRCNNNLAIDPSESNHFASSSLDHPGLVIWDRRVTTRASVSPMYLESFDAEEIPWGASLKLNRVINTDKIAHIKQVRYCREHRGTLAVLSTAGQLQVFKTGSEYVEPGSVNDVRGSPDLLEVKKSIDLQYPYFDEFHKTRAEDRIVSFDWLNLGTKDLDARIVALRANGTFEILQTPSPTAGHLTQFIPWTAPRSTQVPYLSLMKFSDPKEQEAALGPLYATAAKVDVPVFGPERFGLPEIQQKLISQIKADLHSGKDFVVDLLAPTEAAMELATGQPSSSTKSLSDDLTKLELGSKRNKGKGTESKDSKESEAPKKWPSSRELHDTMHYSTVGLGSTTKVDRGELDNTMLCRAEKGYLFDCFHNQKVVEEDLWLEEVWSWIACAEGASRDDGMVSGPLDLSYMGVYTIWMNQLGEKSKSRLIDTSVIPDASQWERLIADINKRAGLPSFKGVATEKPQHRQLCLNICGLLRSDEQLEESINESIAEGDYAEAAALSLFEGRPEVTVEVLRKGDTPLVLMAMALDIKIKSKNTSDLDATNWAKALDDHPDMAKDPYIRAIYNFITTGDWASLANETSLKLRDRLGVALRKFDDAKLTDWLQTEMDECKRFGDIEGVSLAGVTDGMVDIMARYVEKFSDYQTPILIMSFCYPRYINDIRCDAWRKTYKDLLQRNKRYILRVKFEQQSTKKSRDRDGVPAIKPPPRQVTIRCLNCDNQTANDLQNSGLAPGTAPGPSATTNDTRNPLMVSGINAGLCCPRCGSHLPRCAVCMEFVGVPRSDRPELSNDPQIRRMANFPTFCLRCKHVMHMDHSVAWFTRHVECPVPECRCQCNEQGHA